ncbi:hypothetical protein HY417_04225 [Candidatus Kaiserbacteria bacterium]|nr:hypothetical protein [Candidatus Kaiserbacteria bacterium]
MDIQTILRDEMVEALIKELGLENDSPEAQADAIAQASENMLARLFLEIFKIVPAPKHAELNAVLDGGDHEKLVAFLSPLVPGADADAFLKDVIRREVEETKRLIATRQ